MSEKLTIFRILFMPGKDLYGFHLMFKTGPNVLENFFRLLRDVQAIPVHSTFTFTEGVLTAIFFLDFTEASVKPSELLHMIRRLPKVEKAVLIKPLIKGLIADTSTFPPIIGSERALLLTSSSYRQLIMRLREFGVSGDAVLYQVGFNLGLGYIKEVKKMCSTLGLNKLEDLIKVWMTLLTALGYGIFSVVKTDPSKVVIRVYDSVECLALRDIEEEGSHFVRGVVAGGISGLYRETMVAEETRCTAKGDPYCEYVVLKPPEERKVMF